MPTDRSLIYLRPRVSHDYVSQNTSVLATDLDGLIFGDIEEGFFVHETRLVSKYRYKLQGRQPIPVARSNVRQNTWLGYYLERPEGPRTAGEGSPEDAQKSIELRVSRMLAAGLHEDLDVTNFTQSEREVLLEIEIDADFADLKETNNERQQHGDLSVHWEQEKDNRWCLRFDYNASHQFDHQGYSGERSIHRGISIVVENAGSPPEWSDGYIRFRFHLDANSTWHSCIKFIPFIDGKYLDVIPNCHSLTLDKKRPDLWTEYDRREQLFLSEATQIETPGSTTLSHAVTQTLQRARQDLVGLRLFDYDRDERSWTMAAGMPTYIALFGRDCLATSWEAALLGPEMMKGSLPLMADLQGSKTNDWRDEQPGRMIHEHHFGPLSALNYLPWAPGYGSITSSSFYPAVVSLFWHWTGDKELIRPLIGPAMRALKWLESQSDHDSDGYISYKTRSKQGVKHQAWKDSPDAIVDEEGKQCEPPIEAAEEQAFYYLSKYHLSEVLWWLDEKDTAKRLHHEASEFKKRFNEDFWMDDIGLFALGFGDGNVPIKTVASNSVHLLAAGIIDSSLVEKTADRLMQPDLFTGWGIRTLSDKNPAFNPYSYHRGSVWPVVHGAFALGLMRYGLRDCMETICKSQFEAASLFESYRLPEVFSGHQRDGQHPFPAFYPQTNSVQAWSSSTVFTFLQAMLGIYPYAPLNMLFVDPQLPVWFPEVTLHGLRVGKSSISIHFKRKDNGKTTYRVLDKKGKLHVINQPSLWSQTATMPERMVDFFRSFLPGK